MALRISALGDRIKDPALVVIHAVVDRQGLPLRIGLTAGKAHDDPAAHDLLNRPQPRTIVLADKDYDANGIRDLIQGHGAVPKIPARPTTNGSPA